MLTIAYLTNRREPCIQWFFDSLHRQCNGDYTGIKLVVIDFFADYPGRRDQISKLARASFTHLPPKPTVWQGQYRLTTQDYFAAANARNTALCVAEDGYLVYVDDLSVLMPGWLQEVELAAKTGYVALGSYEKVLGLEVKEGEVVGYREHPAGRDSRLGSIFSEDPVDCGGSWLFGASCAIPVEPLLAINGWDEDNDSQGGEDYLCGIMLQRFGCAIKFCPRMKTLESEERHFIEPPFKRIIKKSTNLEDIDASHRILRMTLTGGRNTAPNYASMRDLRKLVLLKNQPFPVSQTPEHDWRDGQSLREM